MKSSYRYLILGKYSNHGIANVSSHRTSKLTELVNQIGGQLRDSYALLGQFDIALIVDLPDNSSAVKLAATLQLTMGISSTTLPATSISQFDQIAEDLQNEIESARMEAGE